jgi:hypothetical protein
MTLTGCMFYQIYVCMRTLIRYHFILQKKRLLLWIWMTAILVLPIFDWFNVTTIIFYNAVNKSVMIIICLMNSSKHISFQTHNDMLIRIMFTDLVVDHAIYFHSRQWISPAYKWVTRLNTSWPSSELKSNIIDNGVIFFVHII